MSRVLTAFVAAGAVSRWVALATIATAIMIIATIDNITCIPKKRKKKKKTILRKKSVTIPGHR